MVISTYFNSDNTIFLIIFECDWEFPVNADPGSRLKVTNITLCMRSLSNYDDDGDKNFTKLHIISTLIESSFARFACAFFSFFFTDFAAVLFQSTTSKLGDPIVFVRISKSLIPIEFQDNENTFCQANGLE